MGIELKSKIMAGMPSTESTTKWGPLKEGHYFYSA